MRTRGSRDDFGNRVANVAVERVEQAVDFEAIFQVEREAPRPGARRPAPWKADGRRSRYLRPTALTAPDDHLRAAAQEIFRSSDDPHTRAERAHNWASGSITYEYGVTGYTTPAAMALHFQKGVCQDFAHILLAVLRLLDIPCRYVSGHLLGEGAPHAWVEALLADPDGDVDVIGYDPTHHRRTRMDYITVAVGRDFSDVTPTSGTYGGPLGKARGHEARRDRRAQHANTQGSHDHAALAARVVHPTAFGMRCSRRPGVCDRTTPRSAAPRDFSVEG